MQASLALAAMLATQILVSLASLVAPVLAPLAAKDFGYEPYTVGIWVSVMYGAASLSSLASGGTIARLGAIRASQFSLLASGLGILLAATGSTPILLLGALFMGAGYGPTTPASSHILARTTRPDRMNLVFSLKQTGVPAGNALAGAIMPSAALLLGWRGATMLAGGICIVMAILLQPLRKGFDGDRDAARPLFDTATFLKPFREVLGDPAIRLLALASMAYAGMQVCLGTFLVALLTHRAGMELVAAGALLSAAQTAGVVGRIVWGLVADHWARPSLVLGLLGLVAAVCAFAAGAFSDAWPLPLIAAVCVAFGGTAVAWNGVFFAQIARAAPPDRVGSMTGGATFFTYGGVLFAPVAFSAILAATGSYALGFALMALFTAAAGLAFLRRLR